ncbi:MAG: MBL fold metallo-hydrolase [Clostridiales bacterium]|nr:MBL fold metallo-hydrolase [Clostridiales bacterium]
MRKGLISDMPNEEIKVTLIANQGILIEYEKTKLLIDALHDKNHSGFSSVSQENLHKLIRSEIPFNNVSYVIFTHCHEDHFSAGSLQEYLLYNDIQMLFLPERQTREYEDLRNTIELRKTKVEFLDLPLHNKKSLSLIDGVHVTYFNSIHAGDAYKDVENYCFLIELNKKNLLFLADADYNVDYFEKMLAGIHIDTLFVNLLYVNKPAGREIISMIQPEQLVVYHIPFEKDDKMHFRQVASSDAKKYEDTLPKTILLQDELQEMNI